MIEQIDEIIKSLKLGEIAHLGYYFLSDIIKSATGYTDYQGLRSEKGHRSFIISPRNKDYNRKDGW